MRPDADVAAAAALLAGACHDLAFHRAMHPDSPAPDPRLPERLVDALMAGLTPGPRHKES